MIEGDFGEAYTDRDNATTIATDSIKNVVNVVAHDNVALPNELFRLAVTKHGGSGSRSAASRIRTASCSTTFSESMQDSLYRMGEAALAAVPDIRQMTLACPNKHYLPINFAPFGLDNSNAVFLPTDEPHGQIECTVGR